MSSKIYSAAVVGLNAEIVEVEADTGGGELGAFAIVGLPDASISESRERVKSAIKNSQLDFTKLKVTVNLAPADLRKQGPSYDLPIAISILLTIGKITSQQFDFQKSLFIGELALSGIVRPVSGILPIAMKAKEVGLTHVFVPRANAQEAKLVTELIVMPVDNLVQLIDHFSNKILIEPVEAHGSVFLNEPCLSDMSHVRGQEQAKRAMEIAAAGGHNILLHGSPGSGKTLLARTMSGILPELSMDEALEITKIYSVSGKLPPDTFLMRSRPFRAPHHTASTSALIGGGTWPRPGEISLAHRGILFLDEFAEFPKVVLESLRQPLEDGIIWISRAAGNLVFPAKFILVSAMNPCPCGYYGDAERQCSCNLNQVQSYRKRISGPIIDRIDLHVEVPRLKFSKLEETSNLETSAEIKKRVEAARAIQKVRFVGKNFIVNSEMSSEIVKQYCSVDQATTALLRSAVDQLHLSTRSYFRILKLARTIADLAGIADIKIEHVAEALQYRPKIE